MQIIDISLWLEDNKKAQTNTALYIHSYIWFTGRE